MQERIEKEKKESLLLKRQERLHSRESVVISCENEIEKDESKDVLSLIDVYNQKIADMAKEKTDEALGKVLYEASCHMKNGYSRSDN